MQFFCFCFEEMGSVTGVTFIGGHWTEVSRVGMVAGMTFIIDYPRGRFKDLSNEYSIGIAITHITSRGRRSAF